MTGGETAVSGERVYKRRGRRGSWEDESGTGGETAVSGERVYKRERERGSLEDESATKMAYWP